jgi:hypothetical protein
VVLFSLSVWQARMRYLTRTVRDHTGRIHPSRQTDQARCRRATVLELDIAKSGIGDCGGLLEQIGQVTATV